jgi:hypothetical protein
MTKIFGLEHNEIEQIISDIAYKQMGCKDEKIVIVYDEDCELAKVICNAHQKVTPQAEFIKFDNSTPEKVEEIRNMLLSLEAGSSVFLIESVSFRLDDFRIRLQLFNNGVGCLEYSHLSWYKGQENTFLNAIRWQGEEFFRLGSALKKHIDECDSLKIYSGNPENPDILDFGPMDDSKINDGRFYQQKNRGGSVVCGEVFSEAQDLYGVNGKLSINCYPNNRYLIQECETFSLTFTNGIVSEYSENTPEYFIKETLDLIKASEEDEEGNGEVMVREAGFGLNPYISLKNQLTFVSVFERQTGFHVSLGKKHMVYRKKLHKNVIQRYHIDVFADLIKITTEKKDEVSGKLQTTTLFENGDYCV